MTKPAPLIAAIDTTWPAAEMRRADGWVLRRGAGGGQRVSAASPEADVPEIAPAVTAMAAWDQPPLFRLTPEEAEADAALAAAGYHIHDPVVLYAAPLATLTHDNDETARLIRCAAPLAVIDEIWQAGGIGPERRAVMARVVTPSIVLMARLGDRPVGCAFVALDGPIAMIHAIEVLAERRREGAGRLLLQGAANWASEQGATTLALAVTEANAPARALYERLGMAIATRYHYRCLPEPG